MLSAQSLGAKNPHMFFFLIVSDSSGAFKCKFPVQASFKVKLFLMVNWQSAFTFVRKQNNE